MRAPRDLTPLVGREVELSYLSAIFDKAMAQSTPQLALIVGEPGIGKSRLVRELLGPSSTPAREMTTWRQGYCPPFGESITYWALAEIVKGHAGIRDTDDAPTVEAKLEAVLPSGPDREWFRQRLRALLGLAAPDASREENFAAWLRFFEDVAAARPTVLVFEDLHWADEALLAFLESPDDCTCLRPADDRRDDAARALRAIPQLRPGWPPQPSPAGAALAWPRRRGWSLVCSASRTTAAGSSAGWSNAATAIPSTPNSPCDC